jgi:hypothetical protein
MQERQQARQPASQPASQRWGMLTGPLRALGPGSFRGAHCLDRAVHCARRAVRSELEPLRVALELKGVGLEASLVERVAWRLRGRLQWAETVRVCADRETHARARSAPQSQVTMKQQGVHAARLTSSDTKGCVVTGDFKAQTCRTHTRPCISTFPMVVRSLSG